MLCNHRELTCSLPLRAARWDYACWTCPLVLPSLVRAQETHPCGQHLSLPYSLASSQAVDRGRRWAGCVPLFCQVDQWSQRPLGCCSLPALCQGLNSHSRASLREVTDPCCCPGTAVFLLGSLYLHYKFKLPSNGPNLGIFSFEFPTEAGWSS